MSSAMHKRGHSLDRASMSTNNSKHRFLASLTWLKGRGHGRTQSLEEAPRPRHVLHKKSRHSVDETQKVARPRATSTVGQLQPRSPVITSERMLRGKAASMDALANHYARTAPLAPRHREQAIEQTRRWQRELDARRYPVPPVPALVESDSDLSSDEYNMSKVWESFLDRLDGSVSALGVGDGDLRSPSVETDASEVDTEPPLTPQLGYLEREPETKAEWEVQAGLGLGFLAWSNASKMPRRVQSMGGDLKASFRSTEAVLGDSVRSLRASKSQAFIGVAVTSDSQAHTRTRQRSMAYTTPHAMRHYREPKIVIEDVDDLTIRFGQAS